MTAKQKTIVEKLSAKGWIDPWSYRRCIILFLPLPAHVRRSKKLPIFRDHKRPPIRITPTGRILAGY